MLNIKNKNLIKTITYVFVLYMASVVSAYAIANKVDKSNHNLVIGSNVSNDAKYLFVLHSDGGHVTNSELTLKDFYQHLIYFSDMPDRVAGNYNTDTFLRDWNKIFSSFNPNVVLSFYDKKDKQYKDATLEISNPIIDGDDVTFKIEKFLYMKDVSNSDSDAVFVKFKNSSLFIDSIACWVPACWK